ncbi:MAG: hypothetical protein LBS91_06465 [Clostridiales Family XIII bacterium]|jgi:hypothetical protein|nr:hypothetical protein [Clostridiales Family XIII bacterium]
MGMTEAALAKQLKAEYGLYMYSGEVAGVLRKSKSRIGKWLEESGVDYFADGSCKKYYTPDVAKAIAAQRVAGYARHLTPESKARIKAKAEAPSRGNVIYIGRRKAAT